jgi:hypothetical protein
MEKVLNRILMLGIMGILTSGLALAGAPPETQDRARLRAWVLGLFGAKRVGAQPDGSVIRCREGTDFQETMQAVIQGIKTEMTEVKPIQFDARILRHSDTEFEICVLARPQTTAGKLQELDSAEALHLNLGRPHYRITKSRRSGEEDLFTLCSISDREENFIFVRYAGGEEEWTECGIDEKAEKAAVDLGPMKAIGARQAEVEELTFYHHHPRERTGTRDTSQTPSDKDVLGFVKIMKVIQANHPALLPRVDFRVVTSTGVYVFKFNEKLLGKRKFERGLARVAIAIDRERTRSRAYRQSNRAKFARENKRFSRKFSRPWMRIRFLPRKGRPAVLSFKPSDARKTGLYVRDTNLVRYTVFHNPRLQLLILRHPTEPVLYDEKGNRIGYVGRADEYVLAPPPGGWPAKYPAKIVLDVYKQVEEKMLRIKLVTRN